MRGVSSCKLCTVINKWLHDNGIVILVDSSTGVFGLWFSDFLLVSSSWICLPSELWLPICMTQQTAACSCKVGPQFFALGKKLGNDHLSILRMFLHLSTTIVSSLSHLQCCTNWCCKCQSSWGSSSLCCTCFGLEVLFVVLPHPAICSIFQGWMPHPCEKKSTFHVIHGCYFSCMLCENHKELLGGRSWWLTDSLMHQFAAHQYQSDYQTLKVCSVLEMIVQSSLIANVQ